MPLKIDIKRQLSTRSERVKAIDLHPSEPWFLVALYNGQVQIWNYETEALIKTFEITDLPVRTAKFIARKSWLITGSDDMQLKVFNYNTHEKVTGFDAHTDYIRSVAVHPNQPFVISSADDMTIKLWDWDKGWKNIQTFEGHTHYVMMVVFNPKDFNTFASASLDKTIKIWSLGSSTANYTLEGHEKGVNCVGYYYGTDKPYLVSGADDKLVKVWDYQNKTCMQTLEGHSNNVIAVNFHPELPLIMSGGEDGTIKLWHASTYRLENTLNYAMQRVWSISALPGSNLVGVGYDDGSVIIKLGREDPAISMDASGKIIWAKQSDIMTANLKSGVEGEPDFKDAERVALSQKELGSCDIYPQTLVHSPNGRFVAVCGDGEYIIYTALAWRNKSFGSALECVWALDSNEYAVRESTNKLRFFKNFKEKQDFVLTPPAPTPIAQIFGGTLIGLKLQTQGGGGGIVFYDWETGLNVRKIDVLPKDVYWSNTGSSDLVAICCEEGFYVLRFLRDKFFERVNNGEPVGAEGFEDAFEFVSEISESVKTGCWVGDCFVYTNTHNRLNYMVGGKNFTISHFDRNMYLLGYFAPYNRVIVADKDVNIHTFYLSQVVLDYQTAIVKEDFKLAESLLPSIPVDQRNRVAQFLDSRNLKELALQVTADLDHKFELTLQLGKLEGANGAFEIANKLESRLKWSAVGEEALRQWNIPLAIDCLKKSNDLEGLFLIYSSIGDLEGMEELCQASVAEGKTNLTFACYFTMGKLKECLELLCKSGRIQEAALFARTYLPSEISRIVKLWRLSLKEANRGKIAEVIADPADYKNLFPDFEMALIAEDQYRKGQKKIPAKEYLQYKELSEMDVLTQYKEKGDTLAPITPKKSAEAGDISDNMSHLSLEVNTTGTGSIREDDISEDEQIHSNDGVSERSEKSS